MPDWLRLRLIAAMQQNQHSEVRRILNELLETAHHPADEEEGGIELHVANRSLRNVVLGLFKRSAQKDYVFANYMSAIRPGRLSVLVPKPFNASCIAMDRYTWAFVPSLLPVSLLCLRSGHGQGWKGWILVRQSRRCRIFSAGSIHQFLQLKAVSPSLILCQNFFGFLEMETYCLLRVRWSALRSPQTLSPFVKTSENELIIQAGLDTSQFDLFPDLDAAVSQVVLSRGEKWVLQARACCQRVKSPAR